MTTTKPKFTHGDTLVEVVFAIAVFAFVAIMSITLMNSGIASAQAALEITMARNEIDAQAEAIRFIHNAFLSERNLSASELEINEKSRTGNKWYGELWRIMTRESNKSDASEGLAITPAELSSFNVSSCAEVYNKSNKDSLFNNNAFVLNTRLLLPDRDKTGSNNRHNNVIISSKRYPAIFKPTPLYPRIIFSDVPYKITDNNSDEVLEGTAIDSGKGSYSDTLFRFVARVEGVWVISVRELVNKKSESKPPEFYDFHIRTCWYAPGRDIPTTIATIIRLYNPEYVEASR